MKRATDGQKMGCSDCGAPVSSTEEQLSRVYDGIQSLKEAGLQEAADAAWKALPRGVQIDFKYTSWTYRAQGSRAAA